MNFPSIAILGPGLLGGSLAMSIRERIPGASIRIWGRREETVEKVRSLGIADTASSDVREIAKGATLIIFCMPVGAMADIAEKIAPVVSADAIITDVGSVKQPVVEQLGKIFHNRAHFIGSHPMAGSEQAGIEAARADLFDGAVTILTPDKDSPESAVAALTEFWETLGCRVTTASPKAHDEAVALISHLPHVVAAAIVQTVARENPAAFDLRGKGFLDTTRVASGLAPMWAEILAENRGPVKKAIHAMIENLAQVSKLLDAEDIAALEQYLAEARFARERLKHRTTS
jgi:prephenate dehydrogenase